MSRWSWFTQPVVLSGVIVTALLVSVRQLGALEALELAAYDQMIRLRDELGPDPRLLVVGITERDIQQHLEWPLPDRTLNQLLGKLEQHKPRVIGLDIFRDLPVEPGHAELGQRLQQSDRIITICKHSDSTSPAISPPLGVPAERVGFSDIVEDADGIIRRNLLLLNPDPASSCSTPASFSLQLALHYLAREGMQAKFTDGKLQIGTTQFKPLHSQAGSYQQMDPGGYQILLNYRSPDQVARQVSLTDVLENQIDRSWVQDRVVLIGTTAPSLRDVFNTPYSASQQDNSKMAGIVLHAQMTSQILSAVLQRQPQFWFWPEWAEVLWIGGWSFVGGIFAWRIQHYLWLGFAVSAAAGAVVGICFSLFTQAGWVPLVPPVLGLAIASTSVVTYRAYQTKQQQEKIAHQAQEQARTIALLQALLREGGETTSDRIPMATTAQRDTLLGNRYKVIKLLGTGGFSQTYLAEDTQRPGSPQCVIKLLQPARSDPKFLEVARRLFETEAEILEILGHHSQIPQLLAYFEENHLFYLVQEFVKGHDLSQELRPGTCLSEPQVVDLLKGVLEILVFVHQHQVIHRDIKPSNVIRRDRDSRLVLIDFGAVKKIQPQAQAETQTIAIGTAGYAPAEQLLGQPHPNSDIYALGIIGIQALTGILPTQLQHDQQTGALVWRHLTTISAELADILDKMVCYHFSDRYQSASEVLSSIAQAG